MRHPTRSTSYLTARYTRAAATAAASAISKSPLPSRGVACRCFGCCLALPSTPSGDAAEPTDFVGIFASSTRTPAGSPRCRPPGPTRLPSCGRSVRQVWRGLWPKGPAPAPSSCSGRKLLASSLMSSRNCSEMSFWGGWRIKIPGK